MARRDGAGVRLITRHGNDFTERFPLVASAVTALPARSCMIDGEAIVCNENGLAVFDLIRGSTGQALAYVDCEDDRDGFDCHIHRLIRLIIFKRCRADLFAKW